MLFVALSLVIFVSNVYRFWVQVRCICGLYIVACFANWVRNISATVIKFLKRLAFLGICWIFQTNLNNIPTIPIKYIPNLPKSYLVSLLKCHNSVESLSNPVRIPLNITADSDHVDYPELLGMPRLDGTALKLLLANGAKVDFQGKFGSRLKLRSFAFVFVSEV